MPPATISPAEISSLIDKLKLSSYARADNINSNILKSSDIITSLDLSLIISQSLSTCRNQKVRKIEKIVSVHKKCSRSLASNYRTISLTGAPSKLLEHILGSSIVNHLNSISSFYPHQHGFLKKFSCKTQLAKFTRDFYVNMNNIYQTNFIFLNFSETFDSVPHNSLLSKLSVLDLEPGHHLLDLWFSVSWLQLTLTNIHKSPPANVTSGFPRVQEFLHFYFLYT